MLSLHPPLSLTTLESHMVFVEGGTFEMGGESFLRIATPTHMVYLDDFKICRFPVSQSLWIDLMGENLDTFSFEDPSRPVESVSWKDIQVHFLPALWERTGDGSYCLPTEAQWEYAARGGKEKGGKLGTNIWAYKYSGSSHFKEVGWSDSNSHWETNPNACKRPNALGLYGMSGNVWEWCQDWYSDSYFKKCKNKGIIPNPRGPNIGSHRVVRGGSWDPYYADFPIWDRLDFDPEFQLDDVGFRLCQYSPR